MLSIDILLNMEAWQCAFAHNSQNPLIHIFSIGYQVIGYQVLDIEVIGNIQKLTYSLKITGARIFFFKKMNFKH